jgi:outer membrane protein TolC
VIEGVEKTLTDINRERAHEAALHRTVAAFTDSASLAVVVYRTGRGDYTDVVNAQRSLASAPDALLQSQVSLARNAIALSRPLGGGWGEKVEAKRPEPVARTPSGSGGGMSYGSRGACLGRRASARKTD